MKSYKRMMVWRHNSFFGQTRMAEANLRNMSTSPTITPAAAKLIAEILPLLSRLYIELLTRKDTP